MGLLDKIKRKKSKEQEEYFDLIDKISKEKNLVYKDAMQYIKDNGLWIKQKAALKEENKILGDNVSKIEELDFKSLPQNNIQLRKTAPKEEAIEEVVERPKSKKYNPYSEIGAMVSKGIASNELIITHLSGTLWDMQEATAQLRERIIELEKTNSVLEIENKKLKKKYEE